MEVRYIKTEEAADFQKVSAASFIWKFDAETDSTVNVPVLAAFNDGELVAGAEIYDYKMNFCGNFLNSIVTDGVCTKPECRRMGAVREIFDKIGETAAERDLTLGFLRPFSIVYYEKFGYANLNRIFSIKIPFESLRHIKRNTDAILYTGEQFDELSALHEKCALRENLIALRDDRKHFCETPLEKADYTYFRRDANGVADGYVRFKFGTHDDLTVEEMFSLSKEAIYGLLGFLRNYDGRAKNLIVKNQYQGSDFTCIADRFDGTSLGYEGCIAGRIYNLKKLLENNEYPQEHGRFSILSIDDLEQNKGIFDVEYQNGKAVVTRRNVGDYDVSLTPPAAAKIMLTGDGYNEKTAAYIEGVEIKRDAYDFFKAFPHRPTRFADSKWLV